MSDKQRLNFWQIWNMSFGFLGIQFGWGLQMANMSAIYEYLGARADQIPIFWLAAPLTGLIVQPIIGHASDRTWNRLGRRRPYFLTGAILSSAALILMPRRSAPVLWAITGRDRASTMSEPRTTANSFLDVIRSSCITLVRPYGMAAATT